MVNRNPLRLAASVAAAFVVAACTVNSSVAQKSAHHAPPPAVMPAASPVVIKTTKESVTLGEFEKAYKRMNDKDPYATTLDSLKDFLNIYTDYRLKLLDAKAQGLETDEKIKKEMDGYRRLLAAPFVLDKMLTEPAIKNLYERRKYEVEAAHFLAMVRNWNNPADTLKAYNRAMKALERLKKGEPISDIVISEKELAYRQHPAQVRREEMMKSKTPGADSTLWEGSDDHQSANDGGSLGWFTGGMTIRPFEDAVYSMSPGTYLPYPVKTKFGYHVVFLIDKRLRLGGIKVHHILIAMNKTIKGPDTARFYQKADSILKLLRAGANFEDLARANSDDRGSADKGGDLGFIDHDMHRSDKPFDDAAYAIKDGQISGIVHGTKGYHIIRRDGVVAPKSFEQDKDILKKMYKSYYFNEDKDKLLAKIRTENNTQLDYGNINVFMSRIDSSRTSVDTGWAKRFTPGERGLAIYTFGGMPFKLQALVDSLNAQPGYPLARNQVMDFINKQIENSSFDYLAAGISKKYPEFDTVMADYQNGIMLFELENRRVWSKVKPDSVGELKFYAEHVARFMWPERIDVSEIYVSSDSLANSLYKRIRDKGENFDTLAAHYTERPGYKEKAGHWGLLTKDENEMSKKAFSLTADDVSLPFSYQAGYSIAKVNRRIPITQKTFKEARQEVASQYQDELSNELRLQWVQELRKKYKSEIFPKPLEQEYHTIHPGSTAPVKN